MGNSPEKILVVGNMGYVGPVVTETLRARVPGAELHGLDAGFFSTCLTPGNVLPEVRLVSQWFMDIRDVPDTLLTGFDTVVYLAAVSNDPIGREFQQATEAINYGGACRFARLAKQCGVRRFIFASSCSMYGASGSGSRTEDAQLSPLTTYARTKVLYESYLREIAEASFNVTALRFATACGMSPRLRLDLVLNDFVASAYLLNRIVLLSDGAAWRPLIDVNDMALAISWATTRAIQQGDPFLAVNVGRNDWNFRIIDLAEIVSRIFGGIELEIGERRTDNRSYRVEFGLYEELAGLYLSPRRIEETIEGLREGLQKMDFSDPEFRSSTLMRLNMLKDLKSEGLLDEQLRWRDRRRDPFMESGARRRLRDRGRAS